jgi:hypothetical protein
MHLDPSKTMTLQAFKRLLRAQCCVNSPKSDGRGPRIETGGESVGRLNPVGGIGDRKTNPSVDACFLESSVETADGAVANGWHVDVSSAKGT